MQELPEPFRGSLSQVSGILSVFPLAAGSDGNFLVVILCGLVFDFSRYFLFTDEGEGVYAAQAVYCEIMVFLARRRGIYITLDIRQSGDASLYPYIHYTLQIFGIMAGESHEPGKTGVYRIYLVDQLDGTGASFRGRTDGGHRHYLRPS